MAKLVVQGARLQCTGGTVVSQLSVLPAEKVEGNDRPAATVMDFVPGANVASFGACQLTSNPQVALATAAALGILMPQPCVPVLVAPWSPGSAVVTFNGKPALTKDCSCTCAWGGRVSVVDAGTQGLDEG